MSGPSSSLRSRSPDSSSEDREGHKPTFIGNENLNSGSHIEIDCIKKRSKRHSTAGKPRQGVTSTSKTPKLGVSTAKNTHQLAVSTARNTHQRGVSTAKKHLKSGLKPAHSGTVSFKDSESTGPKHRIPNPQNALMIYASGAFRSIPKSNTRTGMGIVMYYNGDHYLDYYGPCEGVTTGLGAESHALLAAMLLIEKPEVRPRDMQSAVIITDCDWAFERIMGRSTVNVTQLRPVINKICSKREGLPYVLTLEKVKGVSSAANKLTKERMKMALRFAKNSIVGDKSPNFTYVPIRAMSVEDCTQQPQSKLKEGLKFVFPGKEKQTSQTSSNPSRPPRDIRDLLAAETRDHSPSPSLEKPIGRRSQGTIKLTTCFVEECEFTFNTIKSLHNHLSVEHGDIPDSQYKANGFHRCGKCRTVVKDQPKSINIHKKYCKGKVKKVCPVTSCDWTFPNNNKLLEHLARFHPGVTDDELAAKGYGVCPSCRGVFTSTGLTNHKKVCMPEAGLEYKELPVLSAELFRVLYHEIASTRYARLRSKGTWRGVIGSIANSDATMTQKWMYLLISPYVFLYGRKGNCFTQLNRLIDLINRNNQDEITCNEVVNLLRPDNLKRKNRTEEGIAKEQSRRAMELVRDGSCSKAMALLERDVTPFQLTKEQITAQLQKLHPSGEVADIDPGSPKIDLSIEDVTGVLRTMCTSSSGGPTMWTKKLVPSGAYFDDMLWYISKVLHNGPQDESQEVLVEVLLNSRLVPIPKNDGHSVRPIAVGELFYRIYAKAILRKVDPERLAMNGQFGVKIPCGAEAIIHSVRQSTTTDRFSHLLKIDIANAFNSIHRCEILKNLKNLAPEMVPSFLRIYGRSSKLFHSEGSIESTCGVKQGDPLGPYLFAVGIDDIMSKMGSEFPDAVSLGYLDDIAVLCTSEEQCNMFLDLFSELSAPVGCKVNREKCEIVQLSNNPTFDVLGCPIGSLSPKTK
ncbi:hypothetical protein P9112_005801 [Eukaryota sp. TZLM1-RC]